MELFSIILFKWASFKKKRHPKHSPGTHPAVKGRVHVVLSAKLLDHLSDFITGLTEVAWHSFGFNS